MASAAAIYTPKKGRLIMGRPSGIWARLEMYYVGLEKQWSNVYWYTGAGTFPSNYNQVNAAQQMVGTLNGNLLNALATTTVSKGGYLIVNNGTGSYGVKYYNNSAGQDSTNSLPEDVAAVVQRISDTPGKSGRGRIYISGMSTDMANGSYTSQAGQTILVAYAANVYAAVTDQGITWSPAVFSEKTSSLHALSAVNPIALLGTIRRRRADF